MSKETKIPALEETTFSQAWDGKTKGKHNRKGKFMVIVNLNLIIIKGKEG